MAPRSKKKNPFDGYTKLDADGIIIEIISLQDIEK